MRTYFTIITLICLLLSSTVTFSQSSIEARGNKEYARGEYYTALEYYQQAKEDGINITEDTQVKMGICHYRLNHIEDAFQILINFAENLKGEELFIFANTMHKSGAYSDAIDYYEKAKLEGANPIVVNELIASCKWAENNFIFVPGVSRIPSPLFTSGQSFGIAYYKDEVVYSSANEDGGNKNVDKQGRAFLNLYKSKLSKNGDIEEGKEIFSESLVTPYHIGAICFTSNFQRLYYTKSVRAKGGRSLIKIFMVHFDGEDWVDEKELSINGNDYDCAYPALSLDNQYLYFTSNQPGGFGGKDLYVAEVKSNGDCGTPKNLGDEINTYGDEVYPNINQDGHLYFSSDGHSGFGGLDIFKATKINDKWGNVKNMMQPINSNADDFSYVMEPGAPNRGFLSSNKFSTGTKDVIFYVRIGEDEKEEEETKEEDVLISGTEFLVEEEPSIAPPVVESVAPPIEETVAPTIVEPVVLPVVEEVEQPVEPTIQLPGSLQTIISSTFNGDKVEDILVIIKDPVSGEEIARGKSDAKGNINIPIPEKYKKEGQEFDITFSKGDDFNSKRMIVDISELDDVNNQGIKMTPVFNNEVLDDISGMSIPYEGTQITEEGKKVLDQLASYLLNNPHIVVKLNGHTEARGNKLSNLQTSQGVSTSAEDYLLKAGVQDKNLIPRGYGERYLINKCKRGKLCDESQHLQNRRIDVVVWKVLK